MAHGLYKIRVIDLAGGLVVEYHACTHPAKGEGFCMPDGTAVYQIASIVHMMKNDNNGAQKYISFSHVVIQVY